MNISKITETIFNSSLANFKISVECTPERASNSGPISSVTVNDRGACSIDSSIYLVFSYKGDNIAKNLYMSYPQIPQLISLMAPIADAVSREKGSEGSAYTYIDNNLVVHPNFNEPFTLANIGKRLMGLSVRAILADLNGSNGTPSTEAAVEIRINDPEKSINENALASVLSVDEFLNIFHQIKNLNLVELNAIFSLFYLQTKMMNGTFEVQAPRFNNNNYGNRQPNNNYNGYGNGNSFQYGNNNNYQPNNYQDNPAPRFNNNNNGNNRPYNNNRPQASRQASVNPAPVMATAQQQAPVQQNSYQPNNYQQPAAQQQKIMNARDIEATPISTITFDDTEEIDSLFGEE